MAANDLITFRKGIESQWISANPVLASGEPGYDLTNSILKIGDGVSNWVSLSGIGSTNVGGSSLSSPVGVRGIISTTGILTNFAVSGGYPVGYLDLFQDGVKLVSSLDFSATDGSNVTLSNSVPSGTILEYLTMASGVSSGGGTLSGSVTIPNLGDPSYSSVSLLLHGEGSNSDTTITDNSSNPKIITVADNAQISTSQSKFGSSSIYLPSASISTPSSSDFAFGTGDFTVEFWWHVITFPTQEARLVNFGGTPNSFINLTYGFSSNTFTLVNESVAHVLTTAQSVSLNQWHHIAYTRSSNTLYLFFNGALLGSAGVGGISTPSTSVTFSSGPGGSSYFDEIRITKGVARYTSAFSPPTAVFPDASSLTLPVTVSGSSGSGGSTYDSRWDLFLPPAPTGLTATDGNAQASLSWVAPTVLSQTPITDYTIQYSSNSGSSWTTFTLEASTATSATITGLTNGTSYVFRVAGVNGVGPGEYTAASSSVTPTAGTPPNAPTSLAATAGNAQLALTWTAPSAPGSSAITGYTVEYTPSGGSAATVDTGSTATSYTLTGLTNGTSYSVRVRAVSSAGNGDYSTAVTGTPSAVTVPGAPRNIVVTILRNDGPFGFYRLNFDAPLSDGGSSITGYKMRIPTNGTGGPGYTIDVFNGYDAGCCTCTYYYFPQTATLSAVNALGEGPAVSFTSGPSYGCD
jgi:hypothetical protein